MAVVRRDKFINPKLGIYYSVFTSAFAAIVLGTLILELIGAAPKTIAAILFAAPLLLIGAIGVASTNDLENDYFAAGRRTPSVFAGLGLSVSVLGGLGFVCITGLAVQIGMDVFALVLGWISGLVLAAVLVAPFLRKCGAFTLPGYMGLRFASRSVRLAMAVPASAACLLLAAAELRLAAEVGVMLTSQSLAAVALILIFVLGALAALAGLRGVNWTSAAQAIMAIAIICVPATIISLMISNLPVPQMTHGSLIRTTAWLEAAQSLPRIDARLFEFSLPGTGLEPLQTRFLAGFHAVGLIAMPLSILVIATGIAALPMLASRCGTTPGVYEARKAFGWAVLLTGFALLTLLSLAGFYRGYLVQQVVRASGDELPLWFQALSQLGFTASGTKSGAVTLDAISIRRDTVLYGLPIAAGLPETITRMVQAGALAAALAAALAHLVALGSILTDDLVAGVLRKAPAPQTRVRLARFGMGIAALAVASVAFLVTDPLAVGLAGLAIAAGGCFPVLFLSILWKRLSRAGAFVGILAGTSLTLLLMVLAWLGQINMSILLTASIGGPISFLVAGIVTRISRKPSKEALQVVREMRLPGGETVYDRRLRLERRGTMRPDPV